MIIFKKKINFDRFIKLLIFVNHKENDVYLYGEKIENRLKFLKVFLRNI